jgi:uncharacterized protein (TIGR04255 family)
VGEFSGRLTNAPLVYALCQIRFAPVLKMADHVPSIQEQLRTVYEEFAEEQIPSLQIAGLGETATLKTEARWRFETGDRRDGYILQNSAFVYHTTDYTDFEEFVQEILEGFTTVSSIAGIRRLHRIGLRYIDLIEAQNNEPVEELLNPKLAGFGSELPGVTENIAQYIFGGQTSTGQIVLRVTRGRHNLPLPPDLLPLALKISRIADSARPSVFLDTDHFLDTVDLPVAVEALEQTIRTLKAPIAQAFKLAISDKAAKAWK